MAALDRKKDRGARLKRLRNEHGWTQAQLMEKAGLGAHNHRKLQNWEAGVFDTSDENWQAMADALGTSFHYLYNGEDILPPEHDILKRLDAIDRVLEKQAAQLARLAANVSSLKSAQSHRRSPPKQSAGPKARRGA